MSASGGSDGIGLIKFAQQTFDSIGSAAKAGIMGVILAVFAKVIDVGSAISDVFILPVQEIAVQGANVVGAFIGGMAGIIRQGAQTTINSLAPGASWAVGPLTYAFSIAAVAGGLYVMSLVLGMGFTSDTVPGTFTDFPFLGVDEEDEEQDE